MNEQIADKTGDNGERDFKIEPSDLYLNILLTLTSKVEGEFPITLLVSGMMVSGKLISELEYRTLFLEGAINETINNAVESGDIDPNAGPGGPFVERFIHLKECRFLLGNHFPMPVNKGVLWRGRLSSIDGYFMGILDAQFSTP